MGKVGGKHDVWGEREMGEAWRELGGVEFEQNINVKSGERGTLDAMELFWKSEESGLVVPPGHTHTEFCKPLIRGHCKLLSVTHRDLSFSASLDGYPYTGLGARGYRSFALFNEKALKSRAPHPGTRCLINMYKCFGNLPDGISPTASEIFKEVAFRVPECGDCSTS